MPGNSKHDEKFIGDVFSSCGMIPMRFTPEESAQYGQTPDYKVYKDGELAFYCEVKTIEKESAANGSHVRDSEEARREHTYNKISGKIHEANHQFKSVNPHGLIPNVMAIFNHESTIHCHDLQVSLPGYQTADGSKVRFADKVFMSRLLQDDYSPDLFIWKDDGAPQRFLFIGASPHYSRLLALFGLGHDNGRY